MQQVVCHHLRLMPSKLPVPTWRGGEETYRNGSKRVWSDGGHSSDWLGVSESASFTFWFHQVWGLLVCGRQVITFSHLEGVSISAKQLRYCCVYPLRGSQAPPQGCTTVPHLSPRPFPSLISNCLNLLLGAQGRSWRLNDAYFLYSRNGEHGKAFVTGKPTGSCSGSVGVQRTRMRVEGKQQGLHCLEVDGLL